MLLFIILGLVYAFLSLPIFPYSFFPELNRPSKDERTTSSTNSSSTIAFVVVCILICIISVLASYTIYTANEGRQVWYIYLLPITVPVIFQMFYAGIGIKKKYIPISMIILGITFLVILAFPLRDACLPFVNNTNTGIVIETTKPLLDNTQLMQRFEIISTLKATYDQESKSYVYLVTTKQGYGIIKNSTEECVFYPCKIKAEISSIHSKYPSKEITLLKIDFSDKENISADFAILTRNGLLERPSIEKKVNLNLTNGKISEN